jgi:hypothetical protein
MPKGTSMPITGQLPYRYLAIANSPSGSNDWYELVNYAPVAQGFPNEYEAYSAPYIDDPSVLPHSSF